MIVRTIVYCNLLLIVIAHIFAMPRIFRDL